MRPSWDDVWLDVAAVIARRSLCSRAQVGAVIVDSRCRVVSSGYNGPPSGFDHRDLPCTEWCDRATRWAIAVETNSGIFEMSGDYVDCPALHAEANALMAADRSVWAGGTIYVTGHVCYGCAKLIGNSGLSRVVIQLEDVDRSYRGPDDSYRFLRSLGVGVELVPVETPPPLDEVPRVEMNGGPVVIRTNAGWLGMMP